MSETYIITSEIYFSKTSETLPSIGNLACPASVCNHVLERRYLIKLMIKSAWNCVLIHHLEMFKALSTLILFLNENKYILHLLSLQFT